MFVLILAIGAFIAGVGIGALWIQWITIGALVFIAGAAVVSSISAFDLIVSVFMVVLGFVIGGRWRPRTRRPGRRRMAQSGSDGAAWSSWSSWTDCGSTSSRVESFGGGDSGGAGASASWSDSSSGGDSGGGDSGGGDSGGGGGGGSD
jgi:hypothetical protein